MRFLLCYSRAEVDRVADGVADRVVTRETLLERPARQPKGGMIHPSAYRRARTKPASNRRERLPKVVDGKRAIARSHHLPGMQGVRFLLYNGKPGDRYVRDVGLSREAGLSAAQVEQGNCITELPLVSDELRYQHIQVAGRLLFSLWQMLTVKLWHPRRKGRRRHFDGHWMKGGFPTVPRRPAADKTASARPQPLGYFSIADDEAPPIQLGVRPR